MSKWKEYSSAPDEGRFIANKKDITAKPRALNIETDNGIFPIIIMRKEKRILAYINVCPHQYLPLNYHGDNLLSKDGENLMCTAHGAMFDCETGKGISANVINCALDQIPISIDASGNITIGNNEHPSELISR